MDAWGGWAGIGKGPTFSPAARQPHVSACYQAGASSAKPAGALRSSSNVTIS